jgi:hypothetical protein
VLYQVVQEWETTLEEIEAAGDDLPDVLKAREEARAGVDVEARKITVYDLGSRGEAYKE